MSIIQSRISHRIPRLLSINRIIFDCYRFVSFLGLPSYPICLNRIKFDYCTVSFFGIIVLSQLSQSNQIRLLYRIVFFFWDYRLIPIVSIESNSIIVPYRFLGLPSYPNCLNRIKLDSCITSFTGLPSNPNCLNQVNLIIVST